LKNSRLYTHTATRVIIGVAYYNAAAVLQRLSETQTKLYTYYIYIVDSTYTTCLMPIYTTHTHIRDGPGITRVMKLVLQCVIFIIRLRLLRARINKQLQFLFLTIARVPNRFTVKKKLASTNIS